MNGKMKPQHSRNWLRRSMQFSLRTLLLVMTASAVACWWWLRPNSNEEWLVGNQLKLKRQVLLDHEAEPSVSNPWLNVGAWRLYDNRDEMLVDGQYRHGLPHGQWTLYYPNGRKAAQGTVTSGQRAGVWRTWSESGKLVSEV